MPYKYITQAVHINGGSGFEVENGAPVFIYAVSMTTDSGSGASAVFTESSVSGNINNAILSIVLTATSKTQTVYCDHWLADKGFRIPALSTGTRVTVLYRRYSNGT